MRTYDDYFLRLAAKNFTNTVRRRDEFPLGSDERKQLNRISQILIPPSMSKKDYVKFSKYTMSS